MFIHSGCVSEFKPAADKKDSHTRNLFTPDKIRGAWLMSSQPGRYNERNLIIQYEDSIVRQGITNTKFEKICEPETMLKRSIVMGNDNKFFYAGKD